MYLMEFNISVAVAVGFIALAGVAAETGVVMLIYLDHAFTGTIQERKEQARPITASDLHDAIIEGAVERVRPKMMTVSAIMAGLLPILWSTGTGSEVMQRIAVPMVGGMVSSTVLTLLVIPAIYEIVKGWPLRRVTAATTAAGKRPMRSPASDAGGNVNDGSNGRNDDVGDGRCLGSARHRAGAGRCGIGQISDNEMTGPSVVPAIPADCCPTVFRTECPPRASRGSVSCLCRSGRTRARVSCCWFRRGKSRHGRRRSCTDRSV
jgi:hypothetical protein